jgi:hypothetical protein
MAASRTATDPAVSLAIAPNQTVIYEVNDWSYPYIGQSFESNNLLDAGAPFTVLPGTRRMSSGVDGAVLENCRGGGGGRR